MSVTMVPYEPPLAYGTVVKFTTPARNDQHGLWVVVRATNGKYAVHPLGGSDQYWRGIRRDRLTVVPLEELAKELADAVPQL